MRNNLLCGLTLMLILCEGSLFSKELKYPTSSIPEKLLKSADIVMRDYSEQLIIASDSKAVLKVHLVMSVLAEAGRAQAALRVAYDKFNKLSITSAILYNEFGAEIRKLKNSDIRDYSLVNGYTLYDDARAKSLSYTASKLPYTVDYSYEIQMNGFVGFPSWRPLYDERQSIEKAELVVESPIGYNLRHLDFNVDRPDSSSDGKVKRLRWSLSGVPAYTEEDFLPPSYTFLPTVFLAPSAFSFDGTSGDFSTWKSYGYWAYELLAGRDELPQATVDKIHALVEGVTDKREVVRRVYKYMQSKTRYVSIQMGIGGWQPFPASVVDQTGYGDCKALANYTRALLEAAGVQSCYTLIGVEGHAITFPHFPSISQINHAVVSVPMEKDTIWLECTSQRAPFGYIASALINRNALVANEHGGTLVKTPVRKFDDNREERCIEVSVDMAGDASVDVKSMFYGDQVEHVFPEVWEPRKDQEEALYKEFSIPGIKILDFNMSISEGDTVTSNSHIRASVQKFASKTGSRLFIPVVPVSPFSTVLSKPKVRNIAFRFSAGWLDRDTIAISIPTGFKVEAMPEKKTIESEFGTYKLTCSSDGSKIIVLREMSLYRNTYTADKYNAFVEFVNSATKADRALCVVKQQ